MPRVVSAPYLTQSTYMHIHKTNQPTLPDNASQFTQLLRTKTAFPAAPAHHLQHLSGVSLADIVSPYNTTLDSPCIDFYSELLQLYPDSVVILSVRSSDHRWWESWHGTLGFFFDDTPGVRILTLASLNLLWVVPGLAEVGIMVGAYVGLWRRLYGCYSSDIHTLHTEKVKSVVPGEKLLVFNVEEGWDPLCRFLGVNVPDLPFPRL